MSFGGHLRTLLWKNWLLWKRGICGSLCELLFPVFIIFLLLIIRIALPPSDKSAQSYYNTEQQITYLGNQSDVFLYQNFGHSTPFSWCNLTVEYGWGFGMVYDQTDPEINQLAQFVNDTTRRSIQGWNDSRNLVRYFEDEDKLEDWVTDSDYDSNSSQDKKICFAVVLERDTKQIDQLKLILRFNSTDTDPEGQTTYGTWYPIFETSYYQGRDKYTQKVVTDYQKHFMQSGFVQLQTMVYEFLMSQMISKEDLVSNTLIDFPDDEEFTNNVRNNTLAASFVPMYGHKYVDSQFTDGFSGFFGFFMFITSLVPVSRLISRVSSEKETKIRESMKMMGLTDAPWWLSWIIMYQIIYTFSAIANTFLSWIIFEYSNKFIVFLMFFLYGTSCTAFSMIFGALFSKSKTAILVGVLVFFTSYFTIFSITDNTTNGQRLGLSMFNTIAMAEGFSRILTLEGAQTGSHFDNLTDQYFAYSVADALIFLTIDTFVYGLVALYIDKVVPGEYGTSLPFYFPFLPSFWTGRQTHDREIDESTRSLLQEENERRTRLLQQNYNIEPPDDYLNRLTEQGKAMTVRNLRKQFGSKNAVDGLDLDMFEGQIFGLLGHNGAGKTTTISMLTGLIPPSSGQMSVYGLDFNTDMTQIRKRLGVCPQHDILFKDLTVYEHLLIFCQFKGMRNKEEIEVAINDKIREVDLEEKRNTRAGNLSGGQKRKLSLCIALIGGSQIVMLDEPTSGMDLTARRRMWDMLRKEKNNRIIILTTHYMEEADILADRIAIMAEGKVRCLGSSLFLKNRYGVGYNIILSKLLDANSREHTQKVTRFVNDHLTNAKLLADASGEISFQLPIDASPEFPEFFRALDSRLVELQLETYQVSVTTLEEVFLRVARGDDDRRSLEQIRNSMPSDALQTDTLQQTYEMSKELAKGEPDYFDNFENAADKNFNIAKDRETGWLFFTHFSALLKKRAIYSMRDYKGLAMEIFLPIIVVLFGLILLSVGVNNDEKSLLLEIDNYSTPQKIIWNYQRNSTNNYNLYGGNTTTTAEEIMNTLLAQQGNVIQYSPEYSNNSTATGLDTNDFIFDERDTDPYRMGSYFITSANNQAPDYQIIIFQNSSGYQAVPIFYNAIANSILKVQSQTSTVTNSTLKQVELYNHPLPLTEKQSKLSANASSFQTVSIFAIGMAFIPTGLVTFIVKEREGNVKHQQLVSGVSIPAYWFSTYIWDLAKYILPAVICPLLILAFNLESFTSDGDVYAAVWILFLLFGLSIGPYTYCQSFLFKSYSMAQFAVFMFNLVEGGVLPLVVWVLRIINSNTRDVADVIQWILRASAPIFCFSFGMSNCTNRQAYQSIYGENSIKGPFNWDIAGADMLFMGIHTIVWLIGVFLIEYLKNIQWIRNLVNARDPGPSQYDPDDDVEREKERVQKLDSNSVAVKVDGLRQVYGSVFDKTGVKIAIHDVTFAVDHKECFALLGVNGAGKTSTFRILTGEYAPTSGNAFIAGWSVINQIAEARYNIGYCPQYDALLELLTPKEHLELYARIKGIPSNRVSQFVEQKLEEMGLKKYEKVKSGQLSGGNKRKLSVAMACIGNPPVVFLDEPSAGMDPEARKNMWRVINYIKSRDTSIILTTHSMDEAEALCERIAIMVAGRLRCLGSGSHIKDKFGNGYELFVKVKSLTQAEATEIASRLTQYVRNGRIKKDDVGPALDALNYGYLNEELETADNQITQEMESEGHVNAVGLVQWAFIEATGDKLEEWLRRHFRDVKLLEHYITYFKFNIPKQENYTLGQLFSTIEDNKGELLVSEYSLSQTTLEQVFNMFATNQVPSVRRSRRFSLAQES